MGTKRDKRTGRFDTLNREIKVSSQAGEPASSTVSFTSFKTDNDIRPEDLHSYYESIIEQNAIKHLHDLYGSKPGEDELIETLKIAGIYEQEYQHAYQAERIKMNGQRLMERFGQSPEEFSQNVYNPMSLLAPVLTPCNDSMRTVSSYPGDTELSARQFLLNYTDDYLNGFHDGEEPFIANSYFHFDTDHNIQQAALGVQLVKDMVEKANDISQTVEFHHYNENGKFCIETDFSEGIAALEDPSSDDALAFKQVKRSIDNNIIVPTRHNAGIKEKLIQNFSSLL